MRHMAIALMLLSTTPALAKAKAVKEGSYCKTKEEGKTKNDKSGAALTCKKDDKGKLCAGHLKRWYFFGDEVKRKFGADAEVYRCEHCKTLYLPNKEEEPRTGTLSF